MHCRMHARTAFPSFAIAFGPNTRFSPLEEIGPSNAASLTLARTFSTGVNRGQKAAPLTVGPTMYVVTPHPNILYALDLYQPGLLQHARRPAPMA